MAELEKMRTVAKVVEAEETMEGEGMIVHRPFPTAVLTHLDPFLVLDHMGPARFGPGEAKGAPDHPHRGFETVTYLLDGELEHKDSVGNHGHLRAGDVQWMTAGAGVVHSEMPAESVRRNGGVLHGFQLWVNLPRKDKLIAPRYQDVPAATIPVVERDGVRVKVIAGEALGTRAVIDTRTPIVYLHVTLQPGRVFEHTLPREMNAFVFTVAGRIDAGDGVPRGADRMIIFARDGERLRVSVPEGEARGADFLLIAGQPLNEPIARYGPFVMNTRDELLQAFEDYQSGRMGRIHS